MCSQDVKLQDINCVYKMPFTNPVTNITLEFNYNTMTECSHGYYYLRAINFVNTPNNIQFLRNTFHKTIVRFKS